MFKIESFIGRYFQDVAPYGNPVTDMAVRCPFCGDTKRHLMISLSKEVCHCFKCDYKASWVSLVMDMTGLPYFKAINELYYQPKLSDTNSMIARLHNISNPLELAGEDVELPVDFKLLIDDSTGQSKLLKRYLIKRGFDSYYWKKYNLGMSEKYPLRVIIPIEHGYWQGRSIVPWNEPKYINPKASASDAIFNAAVLEMLDEIVVCEGAFSAMAVGSNAIALIGKEVTADKLQRIIKCSAHTLIIALEPGALQSMSVLMEAAYSYGKKVIIWRYNAGDPADSDDFDVLEYNMKTKLLLRWW
jgi:hypothetical protein